MRVGSWRSQESACFEALGACRAGGPEAIPTLRRGASVPHRTIDGPPVPVPPGSKTHQGGMVGGENFPLARPYGGDAIVRACLERKWWLRAT
eukprot:1769732-Pleurochrysis_carterae.AAC.1